MPYAILRMEKCKGGSVGAIEAHNERQKERYASNPDIIPELTAENYHLIHPTASYRNEIDARIHRAGCPRVRKDSVRYVDCIVAATPEYLEQMPSQEEREFFEHALEFMKQKVGEENIFTAVVHMDERTPHMHLCFTPITRDGRLSAKEIIGNKAALCRWQDEFHDWMQQRFFELERGDPAIKTGREHIDTQTYKSQDALYWKRKTTENALRNERGRADRLERRWEKVPREIRQQILQQERMEERRNGRSR